MNPQQLRQELRDLWLTYYRDNRHWLSRLEIWITYNRQRRPTSSFILGTLSVLNPQLTTLLPLLVDLNHDPDQMVEALGLNFNPEEALKAAIARDPALAPRKTTASPPRRLPGSAAVEIELPSDQSPQRASVATSSGGISNNEPSSYGNGRDSRGAVPPLDRPSRLVNRHSVSQPMAQVTRRAHVIDDESEGRDRTRPLSRPRRNYGQ